MAAAITSEVTAGRAKPGGAYPHYLGMNEIRAIAHKPISSS